MNKSFFKFNLLAFFIFLSGSLIAQTGNVLTGTNSGISLNQNGNANSMYGHSTGRWMTNGAENVLVGYGAGTNKKNNIGGIYIGYLSGYGGFNGDYTIAIGHEAARKGEGTDNIGIGRRAAYDNSGIDNIFIGKRSGSWNLTGDYNVYLGSYTGANATGSRNIFIGADAGANENSDGKLHIASKSSTLIYGDFVAEKVGINNTTPQYTLDVGGIIGSTGLEVCGTIRSEELVIESGWCDFVFYDDYKLSSLEDEADFINENGHLDGFESEEQMDGKLEIADLTKRQQLKIEEIMLHLIQINEEVKSLKAENADLKTQLIQLSK